MSTGPAVATATVRIVPDTTGFRAELQRQIAIATKGVTAQVQANLNGVSGGGGGRSTGGGSRGGAGGAAGGVNALTKESQALRGSLIGLSRVTPVTVFGLGLYGTAAIAAGYAIKGAIRSTADFEHQLFVFQATTGATAEQMILISEKAKALGADLSLPSTSAGDAALAMTELAKAGLTVEDTLAGSTGVLQLAAAAQLDVASSAQFVATQLNAFGLAGSDATHVADLLAGASIAAQGDIRDFGTSFQQVSAVAKQADVSIETTTGALVGLAKAGLRGADGGTSLRTTLLRLTPTTKQAAEFQKILGIELDKTATIGEQLPELLDQYKGALQALNPIQRQQALTQIFGQDAYRAASILIEGGSRALDENTRAANRSGAANELAQANAKGLSGAFNGLKSNLDTLGITLGGFVSGPLEAFVRGTSDGVTAVLDLATALGKVKLPAALGGGGDGKESGLVTAVKRLFTPTGTVVSDISAAIKVAADGRPIKFGESPKDALERFAREDALEEAFNPKPTKKEKRATEPRFDFTGGRRDPRSANTRGDFFVDPRLPAAEQAAIRARFAAAEADRKKRKALPGDTNPTNNLEIAQLNAQLAGNLQAELTADKAIEGYFQKRLKLAKKGSDRYVLILGALQSARAASRSVQEQISSEGKAAAAETKRRNEEAKRLAEENAREAAEAAKDLLALQFSRFELAIQASGLTETQSDDISSRKKFISRIDKRIAALRAIGQKTTEEKQAIIDLKSKRLSLLQEIQNLKDAEKKKSDSGATPEDFFRAAVENFRSFGGGTSGIISAQGARGSLAGRVLGAGGGRPDRVASAVEDARQAQARRDAAALAESRRQTALLRRIVRNRDGKGPPLGRAVKVAQTRTSVAGGRDF